MIAPTTLMYAALQQMMKYSFPAAYHATVRHDAQMMLFLGWRWRRIVTLFYAVV
jgi:hypothetical protein